VLDADEVERRIPRYRVAVQHQEMLLCDVDAACEGQHLALARAR
jgi:hypothetical protein